MEGDAEVDVGLDNQQQVTEEFLEDVLQNEVGSSPPDKINYGRLVETKKSKLNRSGLSRHTLDRILKSLSAQLNYFGVTFGVETMLFTHKPTPKSFSLTTVARGENYKTLLGSETGKKIQNVFRESSKRFPRPNPEKHLGYRSILLKAGKQVQVDEEKILLELYVQPCSQ